MAKNRQHENRIEKRSMVTPREKKVMLSVLIRNVDLFERFKDELTVEHFGDLDVGYGLTWSIVKDFHEAHGELPDRELLMTEIEAAMDRDPNLLHQNEIDDLEAFVDDAFDSDMWKGRDISKSVMHTKWAASIVIRFMEERIAADLQEHIKGKGRVAVNIPTLLDEAHEKITRITDLGSDQQAEEFFPTGWDKEAGIAIRPTGLDFIDPFLGGGHAAGEAYGLMGPFGSCKTTIAVMMAVNAAYWAAENQLDGHGYSFLISFEERKAELRLRALSYAAQIRRRSLELMRHHGMAALSTEGKLRGYEKKLYESDILLDKRVLGEQERAKRAIPFLNHHMIPIDLTGNDPRWKSYGGGYIDEIARIVANELRRLGKNAYAVNIIIDYVGIMVRNHMAKTGKDDSAMRHLIAGAPGRGRRLIAEEFGCPMWLLHQLSGQANKKGPGQVYDHTDAAEATNFGENLNFCLIAGKLTAKNVGQIMCSKHRRFGHVPPKLIKVSGEMNRVDPADDKYVIDPYTRTIKEKDLYDAAGSAKKPKTSFGSSPAEVTGPLVPGY